MSAKRHIKPLAFAAGSTFAASLAAAPLFSAEQNPFALTELTSGYQVAAAEGRCGEAKCGGTKQAPMKSSAEATCGGAAKSAGEGQCGASAKAPAEGKCGEGKAAPVVPAKSGAEGKCGGKG